MRTHGRDEGGVALIAAILVMMVCTLLVVGALQLATHTAQRSGLNRNRSAALHAAEAGIEAEIAKLTDGTCTYSPAEVQLPDQNLPTESYKVLDPTVSPLSCAAGGNAVIAAVGYVPNATNPVATTTLVAHMNRGLGAPASGGTNGGYVFPDALFTDTSLTATAGGGLSVFGLGGAVPNLTAGTNMTVADSPAGHLDGAVRAWGSISLSGVQVGGTVVGQAVTIPAGTTATVQGDVVAAGPLALSSATTVNGYAKYGTGFTGAGATVTRGLPVMPTVTNLGQTRPLPFFSDNTSEIATTLLGSAVSPTTSCPGSGTGQLYDYSAPGTCHYNPASVSGTVVVIAHAGTLKVTVPQTSTGQLYVVNDGGDVTVDGADSTLPVFAYASGTLSLSGAFVGQGVGHTIVTTGTTTMTFAPPSTPMPDFAFPGGYSAPTGTGYAATVAFQYQCPGTTAC